MSKVEKRYRARRRRSLNLKVNFFRSLRNEKKKGKYFFKRKKAEKKTEKRQNENIEMKKGLEEKIKTRRDENLRENEREKERKRC